MLTQRNEQPPYRLLGIPDRKIGETFIINIRLVLAIALIGEIAAEKLTPWNWPA